MSKKSKTPSVARGEKLWQQTGNNFGVVQTVADFGGVLQAAEVACKFLGGNATDLADIVAYLEYKLAGKL